MGRPFVESGIPVLLGDGRRLQELAGSPIEHVEKSVAIGPEHGLSRLSPPRDIGQHGNLHGIPVELVVRRELVVPLQLAGVGVERDDRTAVEVVAGAASRRCSRGPGFPTPQNVRFVSGSYEPVTQIDAPPCLPSFAPGLVSRFARQRHGVESPRLLSRRRIVGREEAADAELAAGGADDHFVFDRPAAPTSSSSRPPRWPRSVFQRGRPVLRVDGDQMRIDRREKQRVAENRQAARDAPAAEPGVSCRRVRDRSRRSFPSSRPARARRCPASCT